MTSKSKRFIKRTVLLLMLIACWTSAYGDNYLGTEKVGIFTYYIYKVEADVYNFTPESYYARIYSIDNNDEEITVPSWFYCTSLVPPAYKVEVVGFAGKVMSNNLKKIYFNNHLYDFPHFDSPNLTDIYFNANTPEMGNSAIPYFSSPAESQITVHLSDKTPEQIVELRTKPGWSNFYKIVKTGEESQKRTIFLTTEHASLKVLGNNYHNGDELEVDKYSDVTFRVDKYFNSDYQTVSVKLNGREILEDMNVVSSGDDDYYTYTILGVINNDYIEVKAENRYTSANVVCGYGGRCRQSSSPDYLSFNVNEKKTISWLKSEEAPVLIITPYEGFKIDRIYSNSLDHTLNAHNNGDGTFSYELNPDANVSVTFREKPKMTTWNVIKVGDVRIEASFRTKRGEEWTYVLQNGENTIPDNMESMTMRIDGDVSKELVVTADMENLNSCFSVQEEIIDEELNSTYVSYYETDEPIPAETLTAKNWVIGLKDAGSQTVTWMMNTKGNLPDAWNASIYLDDNESPLLSISDQSLTASAPAVPRTVGKMKFEINGGDDYYFMLYYNGQPVLSSAHCSNGEYETEDQSFFLPMLVYDGVWSVEFSKKPVDAIQFADAEVGRICITNWDTDHDGKLSKAEAALVTTLLNDGNSMFSRNTIITSFDELQYFTGLTSLEESCFAECEHLQSIVLPSSIQSIGNFAFSGCKALSRIFIPEGVQTIGDCAFSNTDIETFYLPKNVTSIGRGVLSWNDKLVSIVVSPENQTFYSPGGCNAIIKKSELRLMAGCGNTVIPDDVKYISYSAFEGIRSLTEIVLPAGLQSVSQGAFRLCSSLTSVVAKMETPFDVYADELGESPFTGISAECVLTVPAGKKESYIAKGWTTKETDAEGLFRRIEEAQPVVSDDIIVFADANVEAICVENWDTDHDGKLSKAEAAAVTTLIDSGTNKSVFNSQTGITSFDELQYFTGLTSIEEKAFERCVSLASIKLPENITQLNSYSFVYCTSLKHIQLPNGLETLSDRALARSGLTSIFIPKSVMSIGYGVFEDCTQLQSIVVEEGNEKYSSPNGCNAIVCNYDFLGLPIPSLLAGCKNTTIPEDVCWILKSAFSGQGELTKIVIPSKVYNIGQSAFYGCGKLTSIVMERTEPFDYPPSLLIGVGTDAFKNISSECVLTVPHGTRQAYLDAGWSESVFKGGIVEDKSQYDVNRDGEMNITDVTTLVNKILGK